MNVFPYTARENWADGVKYGVVLEMMLPTVKEFQTQRDTYRDTKEAVIRYVQVETGSGRREGVLHGSEQFGYLR